MATSTKSAKTTAAPKTPKAKAAKPSANGTGAAKKTGLRKPQVRILAALAKAKLPLTRKQISEAAPCDLAFLTEYMGSSDDAVRAKNDAGFGPSLLTLGYAKAASEEDGDGKTRTVYTITAKGRQVLEKAQKESK